MSRNFYSFFVLMLFNIVAANSELPIKKCHTSDAACMLESAIALLPTFVPGIPEWNIVSTDPIYFKELDASIPGLKLILKNVEMSGAKGAKLTKVEFNPDEGKIIVEFNCEVLFNGDYDVDGKLLFLPIEGQGDLKAKIGDLHYHIDLTVEDVTGKDGKKHWRVKDWNYSFKPTGDTKIHFGNLFKGNKALSQAIDQLVASSGNEIIEEVGGSVVKSFSEIFANNINQMFKKIPVEDLSLD